MIVTSPLKRAKQTAYIINEGLNIPIIEMDDFVERSYGDAEGMTEKERRLAFPDHKYPNQEDRTSLNKRIEVGIEKIKHKFDGKSVLLVAHGAVINALLATFSQGEIGSGKTRLGNACISNIYFQEKTWFVKDYNQISHLTKDNVKESNTNN